MVLGEKAEADMEATLQKYWDESEVDFDSQGNAIVTIPEDTEEEDENEEEGSDR